MLKPLFHNDLNATDTLPNLALARAGFVISKFTKSGRHLKSVEGAYKQALGWVKNRVNKARKAEAEAKQLNSYTTINEYDVIRAIFRGDEEIRMNESEVQRFANLVGGLIDYTGFVRYEDAENLFVALTKEYVEHPDNGYIALSDLSPEQVDDVTIPQGENAELLEMVVDNAATAV